MIDAVLYANEKIEGWMHLEELNWLYETAKGMNSIIESGVWKGKSTYVLLCGCKDGIVYAIDTFIGDIEVEDISGINLKEGKGSTYNEFMKNVNEFKNLVVYKEDALAILENFKLSGKKFDMVFLDDSHRYEHLKKEIEGWLSLTNKILCGHDYTWDNVKKAVNEVLGRDKIEIISSIWCYRIK